MGLLQTIGKDVSTFFTKLFSWMGKEEKAAEVVITALVPILPQIEKALAQAIADAAAGEDVTALEELIALIAQIKAALPK